MGADQFIDVDLGKTAEEAFDRAVAEAQWEYGHGGYTGTIAEKGSFINFGPIKNARGNPWDVADRIERAFWEGLEEERWDNNRMRWVQVAPKKDLLPAGYPKVTDRMLETYREKWGPAVCFELTGKVAKDYKEKRGRKGTHDRVFLFMGYASS